MTSYTDAVGGGVIDPNEIGFQAITLSASTQFSWPPLNQDSSNAIAKLMTVNATVGSLLFKMPNALQISTGPICVISNIGSNAFTVTDTNGNTIISIPAGSAYYIYLTDNTTANGTWGTIALGIGTSSVSAAALAGYGLIPLITTLNLAHPASSKATNYAVATTDRATTLISTGGAINFTFAASATLGNNWFCLIKNSGTGQLTLTPNGAEKIDGAATVTLNQNDACFVVCDGTALYTIGLGRQFLQSITRLSMSVAGNSNITLTTAQAAYNIIEFTGALTGNISIIVPNAVAQWDMYNNTSGAFTLTVKTVAGTGIVIPTGNRLILLCDGTNVVKAETIQSPVPATQTVSSGTYNVLTTDSGKTFVCGVCTIQLPAANSVPSGFYVNVVMSSGFDLFGSAITVATTGTDRIEPVGGETPGGTLLVYGPAQVGFMSDGTANWFVAGYTGSAYKTAGSTSQVKTDNVSVGSRYQYATGVTGSIANGANTVITFTNAFSSILAVLVTATNTDAAAKTLSAVASTTQVTVYNNSAAATTTNYLVIGLV